MHLGRDSELPHASHAAHNAAAQVQSTFKNSFSMAASLKQLNNSTGINNNSLLDQRFERQKASGQNTINDGVGGIDLEEDEEEREYERKIRDMNRMLRD